MKNETPETETEEQTSTVLTESLKRTIELQQFDMQSLKVLDGIVKVKFYERDNGNREHNIDSKELPHPDLADSLSGLKLYVADILGLTDGWNYAREHVRDMSKPEVLKEAVKMHDAEIERVKITGISFTGSGDNSGLKISYYLKCKTGGIGMASPTITFSSDKLGTEEAIKDIAEDVRIEAFKYLFQGKKLQKDLLDEIDEVEAEEAGKKKTKKKPGKQLDIASPEALI